jgi:hypothetical protein
MAKLSSTVHVPGPLADLASGFEEYFVARGHHDRSINEYRRRLARLSRYLEAGGLDAGELTPEAMEEFLKAQSC